MRFRSIAFVLFVGCLTSALVYSQEGNNEITAAAAPSSGDILSDPLIKGATAKELQSPGGTFTVTPRGSFAYSLPIDVPAGRKGVQPNLSVQYDSQSGSGLLGMGFHLAGLPSIDRVNIGNGVRYTSADSFAFNSNGSGLANPSERFVSEVQGGNTYRTATESWKRFIAHGQCNNGPCYWEMRDGSGNTYYFGGDASHHSGLGGQTQYPATWETNFGTAFARGIYRWHLYKVVDKFGNYFDITYANYNGDVLPQVITYTKHTTTTFASLRTVEFEYQTRSDATPVPENYKNRLLNIRVKSKGLLVRRYKFVYVQSPVSQKTQLASIQTIGSNDSESVAPPAQTFTWDTSSGAIGALEDSGLDFDDLIRIDGYHLGDINGDGKDDLVGAFQGLGGRKIQYALSGTNGKLGSVVTHPATHGNNMGPMQYYSSHLGDINADGIKDLILVFSANNGFNVKFCLGNSNGLGSLQNGPALTANWNWYTNTPMWQVLPTDINADQKTDLVFYHSELRLTYYLMSLGTNFGSFVQAPSMGLAANYTRQIRGAFVGDFNGDGRADLAVGYNSGSNGRLNFDYLPGTDQGLSTNVVFRDTGMLNHALHPVQLVVGDTNGDQKSDVYVMHRGYHVATAWNGSLISNTMFVPDVTNVMNMFGGAPGTTNSDLFGQTHTVIADPNVPFNATATNESVPHSQSIRTATWNNLMADINGDGAEDVVSVYRGHAGTKIQTMLGSTKGATTIFVVHTNSSTGTVDGPEGTNLFNHTMADINGDGRADLISAFRGNASPGVILHYALGTETGLGPLTALTDGSAPSESNCVYCFGTNLYSHFVGVKTGDINGDGISEVVMINGANPTNYHPIKIAYSNSAKPDVITSSLNSLGGSVTVSYEHASKMLGAITPGNAGCSAQLRQNEDCGGVNSSYRLLTKTMALFNGHSTTHGSEYTYDNGRYNYGPMLERSDLGFEYFTAVDQQTNTSDISNYYLHRPFQGLLAEQEIYNGDEYLVEKNWVYFDQIQTIPGVKFIRKTGTTKRTYENSTLLATHQSDYNYDSYGGVISDVSCVGTHCIETTTSYENDATNWNLHRVTGTRLKHTSNNLILAWEKYIYEPQNRYIEHVDKVLCKDATNCFCDNAGVCSSPNTRWVRTEKNRQLDLYGNQLNVTDALDRVTSTTYDTDFRTYLATSTKRVTQGGYSGGLRELTTTYDHDFAGRTWRVTDQNGAQTTTQYDHMGRESRIDFPNGGFETYAYLNQGNPFTQRRERTMAVGLNGSTPVTRLIREYTDGFGMNYRTESESDNVGDPIVTQNWYQYTGTSREAYYTRPHFQSAALNVPTIKVAYDTSGRPTAVYRMSGSTISETLRTYTYQPNRVTVTNGKGQSSSFLFDEFGSAVSVTDAQGKTISYGYDDASRLRLITLPDGKGTTTMQFDSWGRLVGSIDTNVGTRAYTYDDIGNVTTYLDDSTGRVTNYQYDELDRVKLKTHSSFSRNYQAVYNYDLINESYSLGRLGEVVETTDGTQSAKTEFRYNQAGEVTNKYTTIGGSTQRLGESYAYDYKRRLIRKTLPGGLIYGYKYSKAGNLTNATLAGGNILTLENFDALGRPGKKKTHQTNSIIQATTDYTYRPDDDMIDTIVVKNSANTVLQDLQYEYDEIKNIERIVDRRSSSAKVVNGINTDETHDFDYDAVNRLKSSARAWQSTPVPYDYDSIGNMTKKGNVSFRRETNPPASGWDWVGETQIGGITTEVSRTHHNAVGNVTSKSTPNALWSYNYSENNELIAVFRNGLRVLDVVYNFAGERVKKIYYPSTGGQITTYYYGPNYERREQVVNGNTEVNGTYHFDAPGVGRIYADVTATLTGLPSASTVMAGASSSMTGNNHRGSPYGNKWFLHGDNLKSTSVVTNNTGAPATRYLYTPWGEIDYNHSLGYDTVTTQFTGQESDQEIGLIYFKARYYDPSIARFLTADTEIPGDGFNLQGYNRHAYVLNNPVKFNDPSGHAPLVPGWGSSTYEILQYTARMDTFDSVNYTAGSICAAVDAFSSGMIGVNIVEPSPDFVPAYFAGWEDMTKTIAVISVADLHRQLKNIRPGGPGLQPAYATAGGGGRAGAQAGSWGVTAAAAISGIMGVGAANNLILLSEKKGGDSSDNLLVSIAGEDLTVTTQDLSGAKNAWKWRDMFGVYGGGMKPDIRKLAELSAKLKIIVKNAKIGAAAGAATYRRYLVRMNGKTCWAYIEITDDMVSRPLHRKYILTDLKGNILDADVLDREGMEWFFRQNPTLDPW
ncbi:MAG: FG-GAP-like repeat-containing protein [Bdellovibrionota bacterium]